MPPVIVAFKPSKSEHATNEHIWSLYDPALDNPYAVENSNEKLDKATTHIDPHNYTLTDTEHWIHIDYSTITDNKPTRIHPNNL